MGLWSGPRDGEIEQRVNALIARMNLDEKIYAHLNTGRPAAATELGIPMGNPAASKLVHGAVAKNWSRPAAHGHRLDFRRQPNCFWCKTYDRRYREFFTGTFVAWDSDMTLMRWRGGPGLVMVAAVLGGAGPAGAQGSDHATLAATTPLPPLSASERAKTYLSGMINPFSFVARAASAGFGQWRDRPPEWRQGAAGYGRRFASSFAQHATEETLKFGLASLLHEDDRFVPSGRAKLPSRLLYALESTLQSRDDSGRRQVSYSNLGSLAGASLLSRMWQPKSTGGAGNGAVNFGVSVVLAASINIAREFLHR